MLQGICDLPNYYCNLYDRILIAFLQAGSIEGQVVEMGLTTTSLLNAEKFPVIVPNSLFSSQVSASSFILSVAHHFISTKIQTCQLD